ncbi:MFS transporter [Reticulibacter mediterranei]|uniref:MFS transporter n=1 Tax=Reticulibacter mediterranei TaxID=2778369 RepID=A0A8J3ITK7_9CHLR|nr:MFS transporter [Reticulibacter mediterranei]GHO97669.1 MFS transporter [Reticulibacter mediterranei]
MSGNEYTTAIEDRPIDKNTEMAARGWLVLTLLCVAQFMTVFNFQAVTLALPAIQKGLGFSQENLQWVVSVNALAFGGLLIVGGKVADHFGHRRLFLPGMVLFALASLLCGLASSQWLLIVGRALQGIASAIVIPTSMALLTDTFAEGGKRNLALGIWGMVGSVGGTAGVLCGGVLVDHPGWPWIFFLCVPVTLLGVVFAPFILTKQYDQPSARPVDIPGAVTVVGGIVLLVYGLTLMTHASLNILHLAAIFLLALLLLAAFVVIQMRSRYPLIPLSIFRHRTFAGVNLVMLMMSAVANTPLFFFALYMQQVRGYSPLLTGLAFLPTNAALLLGSALGTRLCNRFGFRCATLLGMGVLLLSPLLLSSISVDGSYVATLLPGLIMEGLGLSIVQVSITIAGLQEVHMDERGLASGLLSMESQIGTAIGLALLVTIATMRANALAGLSSVVALVVGFQWAFYAGTVLGVIGLLIAFLGVRE